LVEIASNNAVIGQYANLHYNDMSFICRSPTRISLWNQHSANNARQQVLRLNMPHLVPRPALHIKWASSRLCHSQIPGASSDLGLRSHLQQQTRNYGVPSAAEVRGQVGEREGWAHAAAPLTILSTQMPRVPRVRAGERGAGRCELRLARDRRLLPRQLPHERGRRQGRHRRGRDRRRQAQGKEAFDALAVQTHWGPDLLNQRRSWRRSEPSRGTQLFDLPARYGRSQAQMCATTRSRSALGSPTSRRR
jgi:hypothetical protein